MRLQGLKFWLRSMPACEIEVSSSLACLLLAGYQIHIGTPMTTRIHLTIMQPAGYIYSLGFLDQARYARYQFRKLGAKVTIGKNRLREDSINIIFGADLGFPPELKERYTCVFLNLEQLGANGAKVKNDYLELLGRSAVIDYDEGNLSAYGCKLGDVPLIDFKAAPYLFKDNKLQLQDRPIDILFFGSMNDRRKRLIHRIEACGWNVSVFDQPLYSEERDQFIGQAKAVLNCHFYESSRFEQARVFHVLSLGTAVISEKTAMTVIPEAYKDSVSWFDDEDLENYFSNHFLKYDWFEKAEEQIANFSNKIENSGWAVAYDFCKSYREMDVSGKNGSEVWRPKFLNLGSGKDYKPGWLNIDILERAQPDIVLDLGKSVEIPIAAPTSGGGKVVIEEGSLDYVYGNNVLEHVPDLPCLMSNILKLLRIDGIADFEVPYEKAPTAWQDPTHLRAMNRNSWLYYTEWFWYLGWFSHRFDLVSLGWLDSHHAPCEEPYAAFMRVKLKKIQTTFYEKTNARKFAPDFSGLPEDNF